MTVSPSLAAADDPVISGSHARVITWRDVLSVTWRQHRALILSTALIAAAVSATLLTFAVMLHSDVSCIRRRDTLSNGCYTDFDITARNLANILRALAFLPALAGAFWGAPLVAREIESGTLTLALGQDLSARRWLLGKVVWLASMLACMALVISGCCHLAIPTNHSSNSFGGGFDRKIFETGPLPFTGYAVVAFALGIALGAIVRRALPALALTGIGFFAIWYALRTLRPWYLPAHTVTFRRSDTVAVDLVNTWNFEHSYVPGESTTIRYQPASYVHWLPLVEFGMCIIIASVFLVITLTILRRRPIE